MLVQIFKTFLMSEQISYLLNLYFFLLFFSNEYAECDLEKEQKENGRSKLAMEEKVHDRETGGWKRVN